MSKITLPLFSLVLLSITVSAQLKTIDYNDKDLNFNGKNSTSIKSGITKKKEYLPETSVYHPWPDPVYNFLNITAQPMELGDINGDGVSDISLIYPNVANDKTTDPNDKTNKSVVYYGNNQGLHPSELFYYSIYPVGDINGDGINDVLAVDQLYNAKIKYGSVNGLVDSNIPAFSISPYMVFAPFFDLDKDGFSDFVYLKESFEIFIIWGNSNENLIVSTNTYVSANAFTAIVYEGNPILTTSMGSNSFKFIKVNPNRSVSVTNQTVSNIGNANFYYEDLDADGQKDFFTCPIRSQTQLRFYSGFSNTTGVTTAGVKTLNSITPIGDINNDNKYDFLLFNADTVELVNVVKTNPLSLTVLNKTVSKGRWTSLSSSNHYIKSDFNNDNKEDIYYCFSNNPSKGVASLSFSSPNYITNKFAENIIPNKLISYRELVNVGDMNKDGLLEMAALTDTIIYIYSNGDLEHPIHTINIPDKNFTFQKIESADLNNDGFSDFIAESVNFQDKSTYEFQFFYGGTTLPNTPLKRLNYAQSIGINPLKTDSYETTFALIGSVDGDEYPELIASSTLQPDTLYLYKGAQAFPSTPTKVFNYATNLGNPSLSTSSVSMPLGSRAFNLGDLNGDGYKEFMLVDNRSTLDSKKNGIILIFNGNESLDFSAPNKILLDNRDDRMYFGFTTTVGDFNGDSKLDIATCPYEKSSLLSKARPILSIYYGNAIISDTPDKEFYLISKNLTADNQPDTIKRFMGSLIPVTDINGDKADELVLLSNNTNNYNYLLLGGDYLKQDSIPAGEFTTPYLSSLTSMNTYYFSDLSTPIMNFTGKGIPELICRQYDINYMGDALHRFVITNPFNAKPTDIALSANSIAENQPINTLVGELSTIDADKVDYHTYELCADGGGNAYDNSLFTIENGRLRSKSAFNYEAKNSYEVNVKTTDASGESFAKKIAVSVSNTNETPTNSNLSNSSVAENIPVGTIVGTFSAVDPDLGDTHTFELAVGNGTNDSGNNKFEIVGSSLKTKTSLDYETSTTHNIYIKVTDAGGLSINIPFTITVTDVVETGIDLNTIDQVMVYPNPASDEINIKTPFLNTPVQITMFDLLGKVILKENHNSSNKITIKLPKLEKGIYIIQVDAKEKIWKERIVIN